ncbi:phosphotransferase [Alteribacter aurantiacus]|uniref:phosphotransferase n=1 Tax=Alteribacter aurantiacus TaxID=254410 RepID=UPI00042161BC|nr:phosphotransferase [Alteribacter aurantiacus]
MNHLELGKQHHRKREWKKAISCYEQYINEHQSSPPEEVFRLLARTLRFRGNANRSLQVIHEGLKVYPNQPSLLIELHHHYDYTAEWKKAKSVAKQLVKLDQSNPDHLFRLGRTYSFLKHYSKAKQAYKKAIEKKHHLSLSSLIKKIEEGFPGDSTYQSEYRFTDGKNNVGAIIHRSHSKQYFTKISTLSGKNNGAAREETFYKEVCSDFPDIKPFVPGYVNVQRIDDLSYLTMEMIDAIPSTQEHAKKVIKDSHHLTNVPYTEIKGKYPPPRYVYQFKKGRGISVVHFFTQIHKESYNTKLFKLLHTIAKQNDYPSTVKDMITRLERAIMDKRLFEKIIPAEHYSLLHGDYAYQNILIDKESHSPQVIDWSTFTLGPRFIDIARYVTSLPLPFHEIEALYLEDEQSGKNLSSIEKIFFLYSLVVFYFQKLGIRKMETEASVTLLPALEQLERFVLHMDNEVNPMKAEDLQNLNIKQLQQRVTVLEQERSHLEKRLEDMENSKSWKITRPLRLLTEGARGKD